MLKVPSVGPAPTRIMIVGEAPGATEEEQGLPFVGASGHELTNMLLEAGIRREDCFITNVCKYRPPKNDISLWVDPRKGVKLKDGTPVEYVRGKLTAFYVAEGIRELCQEIERVQPNIIIALGNTPLWALTGEVGIKNWRGSVLETDTVARVDGTPFLVLPTYHPAYILRMWHERFVAVYDLKRFAQLQHVQAVKKPDYRFIIKPTFPGVMEQIDRALTLCERPEGFTSAFDIETHPPTRTLESIAFSFSPLEAVCIPFFDLHGVDHNYWNADEEFEIVKRLRTLMTHPGLHLIGHNWHYDSQYIARLWGFVPNLSFDTMWAQHVVFPGLQKSLAFCASIYADYYSYWKEERKVKDLTPATQDENWIYNCKDVAYTHEIMGPLTTVIKARKLEFVFKRQMELYRPVLDVMLRGCKVNLVRRKKMQEAIAAEIAKHEAAINAMLAQEFNVRSPKQMQTLLYTELRLPIQYKRTAKGNKPSCDDDALTILAKQDPILRPLLQHITAVRSLGTLKGSVVGCDLDQDARFRCMFKVPGTDTYRLASSEDVFNYGTNAQNQTKGDKPSELAKQGFLRPNVRTLLMPDQDYMLFDEDLDRADAQVVAWDADDEVLKQMFREGADIHTENAKSIFGGCYGDGDPRRDKAKAGVHAVNYYCQAYRLAKVLGCTVWEAEQFIKRWLDAHPAIRAWHERIQAELFSTGTVRNAWGYEYHFYDRPDKLLPEALAWIPQSTVAIAINEVWKRTIKMCPSIQMLLQVHDSLVGQFPIEHQNWILKPMREAAQVVIPYRDPLIIPTGLKVSKVSWGEVEKIPWPS